jgi:hypothetical protein
MKLRRPSRNFAMRPNNRASTMSTKDKEYRYKQKQIAAKAYCDRDYGIAYL